MENKKDIIGYCIYMIKNFIIICLSVSLIPFLVSLFRLGYVGGPILIIISIIFLFIFTIEKTESGRKSKFWEKIKEAFTSFGSDTKILKKDRPEKYF